jgi:hypothetical protein
LHFGCDLRISWQKIFYIEIVFKREKYMLAVRGIYDGKNVFVKEPVPLKKECEVIVTFITLPEISNREEISVEKKIAALNRLVGIASKNPVSLEEARAERLARQ